MFDKSQFAELLLAAKGSRSLRNYAKLSDISAAHLSRLSRALVDSPPTPDTLRKLAVHAENGVILKDMMHVCGYYDEVAAVKGDKQGEVVRLLYETQGEWGVRKGDMVDYVLTNEEGETWEWIEGGMPEEVYGRLAMLPKADHKRSIVLRGTTQVENFKNSPPLSLTGQYSIVLLYEDCYEEIPLLK